MARGRLLLVENVGTGVKMRIRPELEEVVRVIARSRGFTPSTVRNVALLYGLSVLLTGAPMPESDWEFYKALRALREKAGLDGR